MLYQSTDSYNDRYTLIETDVCGIVEKADEDSEVMFEANENAEINEKNDNVRSDI